LWFLCLKFQMSDAKFAFCTPTFHISTFGTEFLGSV
jgi:hypothetical protein